MGYDCSVEAISWERVHLTIIVRFWLTPPEVDEGFAFDQVQFSLRERQRRYPVVTHHLGEGRYQLSINIADFRSRRPVPDGTWRLIARLDGRTLKVATYPLDEVETLDERSRLFLYAQNTESYTVSFGISESDVRPEFLIRTYRFFRAPLEPNSKSNSALNLASDLGKRAGIALKDPRLAGVGTKVASRVLRRLFRSPGNRILFASEMRSKLEGNLVRVRDRMLERGLDQEYEFTYSFRLPGVDESRFKNLKLMYRLCTSDIILVDDYFSVLEYLNIPKSVKVIQLWHAGSGFKSIGYSRFGKFGSPKLHNAHRRYTYAISGSRHLVPVYAEAFGIEEKAVIPTGLPRIDTFLDPVLGAKAEDEFYRVYPQAKDKRLILFAPTFRGRGISDAYYDYSKLDFAQLWDFCGDDTLVLFRMHHFVDEAPPIPQQFRDRLIDVADFPETNDLLRVADVLITDYSSVIYEYSLLNRPMVFYAYDREIYAATRGFHRDFELTAPGKVCDTFDELLSALREQNFDRWKIDAFTAENFDNIDTHSADRVIDWLILGDPPANVTSEANRP
ncbi:MAG TPA: CDP-glycerol glycerophosphotransferase family protein [Micropruina sp.]|nr:CDP-glycerol glycerophosphotransferase family protein [Micropruina sp.]